MQILYPRDTNIRLIHVVKRINNYCKINHLNVFRLLNEKGVFGASRIRRAKIDIIYNDKRNTERPYSSSD